ncbi:hypothetical protein [Corynebacterium pseudodiphtheriticum]|uniref:hypothetical protein n=1 Tax=Corynebacterium pseudodiphtheriticum TaxID=37637 RepID=UPI0012DD7149|nr:hypothetical protein [Corynebacterium pseudodiphtheriticum]MCG7253120.1 hypothetical protein [Corynebacterium pseudodiphtheriticum]
MLIDKNYILVTLENQESHKSARTRRGAEGLYDKKRVRIGGIDADKDIKTTHL